tara:strand:+ start:1689 stop:2117 length:429 start_codon:yes stop_codon:yes gene_type:complete
MKEALNMAKIALNNDEVPIGCIIVEDDIIIGKGFNQVIRKNSPIFHAEIAAINDACSYKNNFRLPNSTLYTTVEPCHMCASAIIQARISEVIFGADEPKTGAVKSQDNFFSKKYLNHKTSFRGGILKDECASLMLEFFKDKR